MCQIPAGMESLYDRSIDGWRVKIIENSNEEEMKSTCSLK